MDYITPAVIAALVSGAISVVGLAVNRSTNIRIHRSRMRTDLRLASKKFNFDCELAKRKFNYDVTQAALKRKFDLADQMLSDAYKLEHLIEYARSGFTFEGEGETRKGEPTESESKRSARNSYFVPFERLNKEKEFIGSMMARRYTARALFGPEADEAFTLFNSAIRKIQNASVMLSESSDEELMDREFVAALKVTIWSGYTPNRQVDLVGAMIKDGVSLTEKFCRPALSAQIGG
jgi:hypothetical protein